MATEKKEELFPTIGKIVDKSKQSQNGVAKPTDVAAEDDDRAVTEIPSLCMQCHEEGVTRLLLTSIPFFKEIVVMSFRCEHCGAQNNEIQSAGEIRVEGAAYTVRLLDRSDLNRQLVRSATCEIKLPDLDLTLPPTSRGQLTTVEGLLREIVSDLSMDQPLRRIQTPENYEAIEKIITKLKAVLGDPEDDEAAEGVQNIKASERDVPMVPFTLTLDDPAGNSFIEFVGSMADPKWSTQTYHRTYEQNVALGLVDPDEKNETPMVANPDAVADINAPVGEDEILVFPGICSSCGHPITTNMKKVNIPYFKDILIMSTNCEHCGYRDNEVKSGSAISEKGKRITLKVEDREDLSRDILKSETAGLTIPEIDLVLTHGTLGGRFTTLEGLLTQVYEELGEKLYMSGDSSSKEDKGNFNTFIANLKAVMTAERPFTVILDDPLANSYIQNIYAPDPDPNMVVEYYERSWENNEELGLNDIKVEGYEEEAEARTQDKKGEVNVQEKKDETQATILEVSSS